jgi:hypothetical protein
MEAASFMLRREIQIWYKYQPFQGYYHDRLSFHYVFYNSLNDMKINEREQNNIKKFSYA